MSLFDFPEMENQTKTNESMTNIVLNIFENKFAKKDHYNYPPPTIVTISILSLSLI